MQVYRDLRIITARPTPEEERRVPHVLYGHVDAAEDYSVGRWCADAAAALAAAQRQSRAAILVGGTGLYFNALTRGLAAVPPIPDRDSRHRAGAARERRRRRAACRAAKPRSGRGGAADARRPRPRHPRAGSGVGDRPFAARRGTRTGKPARLDPSRAAKIFLMPDRDELLRRIDTRFDAMIAAGAIEEVRALAARRLDPDLPAMKAHGVPWLIRHLNGEIALAEAVEGAKRDTRQYTKRQATWFRNQLPDFAWVEPQGALAAIEAQLRSLAG